MGLPALATWRERVAAYLLDHIPVIALGATATYRVDAIRANPAGYSGAGEADEAVLATLVLAGAISLAWLLYNRWWLQGRTGQSWGKRVRGLRLVRRRDGRPLGAALACYRDLLHAIFDAGFCLGIGFLFPVWDSLNQTLADKLVGSVVVKEDQ